MTLMKQILPMAMIGLFAGTANGQLLDKKVLSLDGAKKVLAACEAEAKAKQAGGVIAVVDDGGSLIALHRIDGTFVAGAEVSIGKARTAAIFKKPTRFFEETIKNGRTAMVALNDFTPLQGGVPIVCDGQVVGAVGVSGAASAQQDEEIAMVGARSVGIANMQTCGRPQTEARIACSHDRHAVNTLARIVTELCGHVSTWINFVAART